MWKIILNRLKQGRRTIAFPKGKLPVLPPRYRGRPPSQTSNVDLGEVTFVPDDGIMYGNDYQMAVSSRDDLKFDDCEKKLAQGLDKEMLRIFGRSLKLRQVSAGGCNACEADVNVLNTVVFDLSRFGIQFVASPRHADGLLVTGPITRNMKEALLKTYEAMPSPKIVIAVGACAVSGGIFSESQQASCGLDTVLHVDLYVPGCPPHPLTILDGLLRILAKR
jgi:Ni,Fe-hydrogenase III small subunit